MRTVLPKSNREAAHSPPRHRQKPTVSASPPVELTVSPSLPPAQEVPSAETILPESKPATVDSTTSPMPVDKTHPKMIKQRSFSSKTIYRPASSITTSRSSDQADCADPNHQGPPRELTGLFLRIVDISFFLNLGSQHNTSQLAKPKSFEDDASDLQRKSIDSSGSDRLTLVWFYSRFERQDFPAASVRWETTHAFASRDADLALSLSLSLLLIFCRISLTSLVTMGVLHKFLLLEITETQSELLPSLACRCCRRSSALPGLHSAQARLRSSLSPSPDFSRRNSGIIIRSCSSVCMRVSIDMTICMIHPISLLISDETHLTDMISLDCQHSNRSKFSWCAYNTLSLGGGLLVELFFYSLDYHSYELSSLIVHMSF